MQVHALSAFEREKRLDRDIRAVTRVSRTEYLLTYGEDMVGSKRSRFAATMALATLVALLPSSDTPDAGESDNTEQVDNDLDHKTSYGGSDITLSLHGISVETLSDGIGIHAANEIADVHLAVESEIIEVQDSSTRVPLGWSNSRDSTPIGIAIAFRNAKGGDVRTLRGLVHPPTDPSDGFGPMSYLASESAVKLAWHPIRGVTNYTVEMGEEILGETEETSFLHSSPVTESTELSVVAQGDEADAEVLRRQDAIEDPSILEQLPENAAFPMYDVGVHVAPALEVEKDASPREAMDEAATLQVAPSASANWSSSSALASTPTNATIRQRTWIANHYVSVPAFGLGCEASSNQYFGGDQRSFHSPTFGTHRTETDLFFGWPTSNGWELRRSIGETRLYKLIGNNHIFQPPARTASSSGISANAQIGGTWARYFSMNHEVPNPYCASATVDSSYSPVSSIARSRSYRIASEHSRYPSYSVYYKDNTTSEFHPIRQWNQATPYCLVLCSNVNYDRSGVGYS